MQSDNLLRNPLPSSVSFSGSSIGETTQNVQQLPTSPPQQLFIQQPQHQQLTEQQVAYFTPSANPVSIAMATPPSASVIATPVQQQVATGSPYIQQQQLPAVAATSTPQNYVITQVQATQFTTPLSSVATSEAIVTSPTTPTSSMSAGSPLEIAVPVPIPLPSLDLDSPTETPEKKKTKRGVLPKQATNIMKTWLFSHSMVTIIL